MKHRATLVLAVLAFAVALSVACGDGGDDDSTSPTSPSVSLSPAPETSSGTSNNPGNNPAPAPTPENDPHAKEWFETKVTRNDGDLFEVRFTNISDENRDVRVTCYEGPPSDLSKQTISDRGDRSSIGAGSTATLSCVPACGIGQGDGHIGPPVEPPFFGRALIIGRPTRGSGPRCDPPPPEGCTLDLECREENGRELLEGPTIPQDVHKFIRCNHPVSWQHNATEASTGDTTLNGWWESREQEYQGFWKATAQRDPKCMVQDSFRVKPPVCDVPALRRQTEAAAEQACEFGVESITIDEEACTGDWTCKPEPPCDLDALRREAEQTCEFGFEIDERACEFKCLECEDVNPPSYSITSASLTKGIDENGRENRVTVNACFEVSGLEANGEIFWQNGGSSRVKKEKAKKAACGETVEWCLEWSSGSSSHLCRNGANYTARLNPIDGGVLPTKTKSISCN